MVETHNVVAALWEIPGLVHTTHSYNTGLNKVTNSEQKWNALSF